MQSQPYYLGKAVYKHTPKRPGFSKNRVKDTLNFGPDVVQGVSLLNIPASRFFEHQETSGSSAGFFSTVEVMGDVVRGVGRKVPRAKDGYWEMDGKLMWLQFCREHPDLYGVPKVHSLRVYNDTFSYIMDRYEYTLDEAGLPGLNATEYGNRQYVRYLMTDKTTKVRFAKCLKTLEVLIEWLKDRGYTVQYSRVTLSGMGVYLLDLHSGNIMADADGELRITDPIGFLFKHKKRKD